MVRIKPSIYIFLAARHQLTPTQTPDEARLNITIVGAGLSGIAAAISCAASGHAVQVIEQAKELAEVKTSTPLHPQ